jgi:hypothetical protein
MLLSSHRHSKYIATVCRVAFIPDTEALSELWIVHLANEMRSLRVAVPASLRTETLWTMLGNSKMRDGQSGIG